MRRLTNAFRQAKTGKCAWDFFLLMCVYGRGMQTDNRSRYQSSVTFSGFLNALDGVASGEERIIFLTTNHIDRLDPALIRPGRVDLASLVGDAVPEQARTLFTNFYGNIGQIEDDDTSNNEVELLGRQVEEIVSDGMKDGHRISMAALQGMFIRHDAKDAVASARELLAPRQ